VVTVDLTVEGETCSVEYRDLEECARSRPLAWALDNGAEGRVWHRGRLLSSGALTSAQALRNLLVQHARMIVRRYLDRDSISTTDAEGGKRT
jgi:hypothetical protein